jgi:uncharacterized YccA/Bax inhibitor family protein
MLYFLNIQKVYKFAGLITIINITMALRKTANPALNRNTFLDFAVAAEGQAMTIQGTVNKVFLMTALLLTGAVYTWKIYYDTFSVEPENAARAVTGWLIGGAVGGLIIAVITMFRKTWSPYTAPIYAVLEGLVLGGISAVAESSYPGVVIQAVVITFGILISLLLAYKSRLIKPTQNFRLGVAAATGGVFFLYLITFLLNLFGIPVGYLHNGSPIAILINVAIVIIAALNLVLDFDFIEQGAEHGAPRYMEWYAAFGLMVTLIWLYIEVLRLLTQIRSNR